MLLISMDNRPPMPVRESPDGALLLYTVLMVCITAGFFAWWLFSARERRVGVALPALLIGGAISGLMESWLDNVVLVGYPPDQALPVLESFDRSVPIFVPIGYAWFCGGLLYLSARGLGSRPLTRSTLWGLLGVVAVVDFVAIGLSHWIGVLEFYGDPPFEILGYPLWWAGIDGLHVVLGSVVVAVLLPHLRGASQWWLIAVPSVILGAASGIVGWPISTALNSSWDDPAKYAAAVVSMAFSATVVHFLASNVRRIEAAIADDQQVSPGTTVHVG